MQGNTKTLVDDNLIKQKKNTILSQVILQGCIVDSTYYMASCKIGDEKCFREDEGGFNATRYDAYCTNENKIDK